MKYGLDEKPILILVKTYDIPYNQYFVDPVTTKDYLKFELHELNVNQANTGASWDSYIPLSFILKTISKMTKILKINDSLEVGYKEVGIKMYNKGLESFETVIRKRLVDYAKGDIYV